MPYLDLKVNDKNIRQTFLDDSIGRNQDLMSFVATLYKLANGNTFAIDSAWGAGKTFFVKQAAMILKNEAKLHFGEDTLEGENLDEEVAQKCQHIISNNSTNKTIINDTSKIFAPIYYDAWKHDDDENAAISLISVMLQELSEDFNFEQKTKERLATIFEKAVKQLVPQKINALLDIFKKEKTSVDLLFSEIKTKDLIDNLMSELVEELLLAKATQLIIFIDELDRCKPTYAIQLLEQIKHHMNDERITFVFSVNVNQLQHTISHYYGSNFDSIGYLERFFDVRMDLPSIDADAFYRHINFSNNNTWISILQTHLMKYFQFSMRTMPKFLNSIEQAIGEMSKPDYNWSASFYGKELQINYCLLVPFMIGLKMKSEDEYQDFINGKNIEPLLNFTLNVNSMPSFLNSLLNDDERFEERTADSYKNVKLAEKVQELYDCIFIKQYNGYNSSSRIGECTFSAETKGELLKKVGLI